MATPGGGSQEVELERASATTFVGSGALAVGARIPRLWSGPEVIDVVFAGFWLIAAALFVGHLLRIRRALIADRRDIA